MTDNNHLEQKRWELNKFFHADETACVNNLLSNAELPSAMLHEIKENTKKLVSEVREQQAKKSSLDAFLYEYDLSSEEGVALMCLAEAMLRIPDADTVDDLIRDKITSADWEANLGKSESFFVNASTWALMLTGKIVNKPDERKLSNVLHGLLRKSSEPFIRKAVGQGMKVLGKQFVMGRTINEALKRMAHRDKNYRYSFDMLGEAARTQEDAERYYQAYVQAIAEISKKAKDKEVMKNPGISVKLSALHPRYEYENKDEVIKIVAPLLLSLAMQAKAANINLTVDAEEARVLDLSLEIIKIVYQNDGLEGWEGFGLAVQSYQKRAWYVIDWLVALYETKQRKIPVRLIKGAYWDAEIKHAQVEGHPGYPVFTRKNSTDVSFIACAKKILSFEKVFYPQFGTHNAYSAAVILSLTNGRTDFEFQCLHGMGQALYDLVIKQHNVPCRIYAPVGTHKVLLAYLVRRLLENGANTSFVNRLADVKVPLDDIAQDPVARVKALKEKPHPKIPLPKAIFGKQRENSKGYDLSDLETFKELNSAIKKQTSNNWSAVSVVAGKEAKAGNSQAVYSPIDGKQIGVTTNINELKISEAIDSAHEFFNEWDLTPVEKRAACLRKAADLLEERTPFFIALMNREAGKGLHDCIAEVREAVDFCRYYAMRAEKSLAPEVMPGPTGEFNQLYYRGRGAIACISPWNFPLAIFMGQVVAALVAGNTVLAKPAEQTTLVAFHAVKLLHEAGIPGEALQLLLGPGEAVGTHLVHDERVKGVMFTGSTETAKIINQSLASRSTGIVPFIAETGGQNAMLVDSSALFEQVVKDVIDSAFGSAGQRCSALRVLYLQDDIADEFLHMLKGAMADIKVGDPINLSTDVGPVIDQDALDQLEQHLQEMDKAGKLIYQCKVSSQYKQGSFFAPCAFEIKSIKELRRETFGPFLHVVRFSLNKLDKVLDDILATGFGLTGGVHSRISQRIEYIAQRMRVGNLYVNRNTIGAVVGVQPFGGQGLSGTGPKAGGPNYLHRLVTECTLTVDTTASGGNASLLTLSEEED